MQNEKLAKYTIPWLLLAQYLEQKTKDTFRVDCDVTQTQIPTGPMQHQDANLKTNTKEKNHAE